MLYLSHLLLIAVYLAMPVLAVLRAMHHFRQGRTGPMANLLVTVFIGMLIGTAGTTTFAMAANGRVGLSQFFIAIYFSISMLLVFKALDAMVSWLLDNKRRARRAAASGPQSQPVEAMMPPAAVATVVADPPARAPSSARGGFALPWLPMLIRGLLLVAIGMPYILSSAMVFRLKIKPGTDPLRLLGDSFTEIRFDSTDGMNLSGWWIPATSPSIVDGPGRSGARRGGRRAERPAIRSADPAAQTVIICHGAFEEKSSQLVMARSFISAGYNVLLFDFRAHGQSDGYLSSFGDLERQDVLGAIRWLRENHPQEATRIVGLGVSTGGAALIAAAADPGADGQSIAAVAVIDTFDDLQLLARDIARASLLPPMDRLTTAIGIPLASLQTGTNLARFKPAELITRLWPRPVMVLQATHDQMVPFARGQRLFQSATLPRQSLWLIGKDLDMTEHDRDTADAIRAFFDTATAIPLI